MTRNLKRTAHIISHTHWDREWYLPYEKHHVRLIELMDTLLQTIERDSEFKSFYLDGQTIMIEDYLQVRPEKKEQIEKYIREGRIYIGPWYILQDAFLTSSEANLRNIQIGIREAKKFGAISKVGYFPDTFGIMGQAPQILQQAGIDNALFGRGVKPTGFNNTVADSEYESSYSELVWEGTDGSQVLGILFANWYCNGMEIPTDEEEARTYWLGKLADAEKYASTRHLLFMNGCDHQPVQQDLSEAIRTASTLFPDTEFIHSNVVDYLQAVRNSGKKLSVVKGELRSQRTDGWSTLVNTASSRVYLKQMNQLCQSLLEKVAEPLASIAYLHGSEYPHHLFAYGWKILMQNHPHDSICGCSVDEVHQEMVARFDKSRHVAEVIIDNSKRAIADKVDTSSFSSMGESAVPFVVFNTTGWSRSGIVTMELETARIFFREGVPLEEMNRRMSSIDMSGRTLVDAAGRQVPCSMVDLGLGFGYELPDNKFRQPYMCRKVRITFEAVDVPALGAATYAWMKLAKVESKAKSEVERSPLLAGVRTLENKRLRVEVADNGSLMITDKLNSRVFRDLCVFEDTGDIGNEYMYKQPEGELPLTTRELKAEVTVVENTPYRAALEIVHQWEIPACGDELFEQEKRELIYFPRRLGQRVKATVPITIRTIVSLSREGKGVELQISFCNQAKDHRLRALFPTDVEAEFHRADSIFEVAVRSNHPSEEWENPSNTQHQQSFVDVSRAGAGLAVANLGLQEYEILRDGRNTIAVTLLRSTGELGDWGYFPTPEAQCIGDYTAKLEIIPHSGNGAESGAYAEAYQFQVPWSACQTGQHNGSIPSVYAPFHWQGIGLAHSSLKVSDTSGDLMLRWYNMLERETDLTLQPEAPEIYDAAYRSNILEGSGQPLPGDDGRTRVILNVRPYEILTIGLKRGFN